MIHIAKIVFKSALALGALLLSSALALAATLLPNGEQQFVDQNGAPYASGTVCFYIPSTLTPKLTWQNATQTIANTSPCVTLDAAGRAILYGAGTYRQILKDNLGNTIWDQVTQGYGTSGFTITNISGSGSIGTCNGYFNVNNVGSSAITLTLPLAPSDGDGCWFTDTSQNSSTYNIILGAGTNSFTTGQNTAIISDNGTTLGIIWYANAGKWALQ